MKPSFLRMDFVWSGELLEVLVRSIAVCEHSYSRTINLMSATWNHLNMHGANERAIEKAQRSRTFFRIWTESRLDTAANNKTKFTFQFLCLCHCLSLILSFRFSIAYLLVLFSSFVQHCVCCSHVCVCVSAIELVNSRMCTIKLEIEKIHCKGKNQAWNWILKATKTTSTTTTTTTIAVCSLLCAHAAHSQCKL